MAFMTLSNFLHTTHGSRTLGSLLALALVTVGSSYAQEISGPEPEVITLATFHLSNGNTVEFHGVPAGEGAEKGVGYSEKGTIGESMPIFFKNEQLTMLQRFLILAPEDTPLPRMLVENGGADYEEQLLARLDSIDDLSKAGVPSLDQLTAQRGIVEELPESLEIALSPFELTEKFQTYAQGTPYLDDPSKAPMSGGGYWNCGENDGEDFSDRWCRNWDGPESCDSGKNRRDLTRHSGNYKRKASYSVEAFCGGVGGGHWNVRPKHYWFDEAVGRWTWLYTGPRVTGNQWAWSTWWGSWSVKRKVKHDKDPERNWTGYFRAWTAFYNPY